jgi:adenylate cyclase
VSACARCGRDNPDGNAFCGGCGARLDAPSTPDGGYTPAHLAEEVLTRRRALQGERKQVTVMFVDLKGSLALSEQLDPEVWHRLLDRFFSLLASAVHDFEGTINQFTGDGVMALFGAPLAHEDHAYRACRAALRIGEQVREFADDVRREHGIALAARIGLNSGEVVVGRIGDDLRMDYTAQGATVGLAARMQELAEPGRPCLAEDTAALVEGLVELRELGPVAVKGLSRRVRVFELLGLGTVRTRFEAARARGLSPFLGRAREARALEEALASALRGEGGVVGLVGPPGVGKSRLAFEALQRARAAGLSVIQAEGLAHARRLPLLPIAQLVRRYLGVADGESGEAARQKIAGRLVLLDRELAPLLPLVFDFLGLGDPERTIPIDPSARQRQLFEVVRRFLRAQSDRDPTVLLLEDLHWFDPASDRVLEQIVEAVVGTRLLVLVTYRPEYEAPWMRSHRFRRIEVDALPPQAADDLLRELLGDDPSLAGVARRIRDTAGGNPLFLEEVVRSLVESGELVGERGALRAAREVEAIEVPGSVQSVLAERLDRLPEAERATLEAAAIVGPRVPATLLGRLLGRPAPELAERLDRLCGLDLLQRDVSSGDTYAFRHPLIQDVAYRSQLAEHRAPIHARLARILSEPVEGRSEPAALVALHWERAGEIAEAARANARAAEGTGSLDPVETFRLWSRTRELAARLGDEGAMLEATACVQLLNFGWRHGLGPAEADDLFFRGRALLEGIGNLGFQAMLHASYGRNLACTAHAEAYLEQAEQALALARESGSDELVGSMESVLAHALRHAGRLEESLRLMEACLERLRRQADDAGIGFGQSLGFSLGLWLRALRGDTLVFLGRLADAASDEAEVAAAATARGDADLLILPRWAAVTVAWARGDPDGGLGPAREASEIAERQGSPYARVLAGSSLGSALLQIGDARRAGEVLADVLATAREHRAGLDLEGRVLSLLAEARFDAGAVADARRLADEAAERSRERRTPLFECFAELARARIHAGEAPEACDAALSRLDERVEATGAHLFVPFAEQVRAARARAVGDADGAAAARTRAREGVAKMGAEGRVARIDRGDAP